MNVLHLIRIKSAISQALALTLVCSLIILPLASWGAYDAFMHINEKMDAGTDVGMNNCHLQSNDIDLQGCEKNCCNDDGPNHNCENCPNSCVSTVFISFYIDSVNQLINHYGDALNFQSTISSRKITPPFRPPITLLS